MNLRSSTHQTRGEDQPANTQARAIMNPEAVPPGFMSSSVAKEYHAKIIRGKTVSQENVNIQPSSTSHVSTASQRFDAIIQEELDRLQAARTLLAFAQEPRVFSPKSASESVAIRRARTQTRPRPRNVISEVNETVEAVQILLALAAADSRLVVVDSAPEFACQNPLPSFAEDFDPVIPSLETECTESEQVSENTPPLSASVSLRFFPVDVDEDMDAYLSPPSVPNSPGEMEVDTMDPDPRWLLPASTVAKPSPIISHTPALNTLPPSRTTESPTPSTLSPSTLQSLAPSSRSLFQLVARDRASSIPRTSSQIRASISPQSHSRASLGSMSMSISRSPIPQIADFSSHSIIPTRTAYVMKISSILCAPEQEEQPQPHTSPFPAALQAMALLGSTIRRREFPGKTERNHITPPSWSMPNWSSPPTTSCLPISGLSVPKKRTPHPSFSHSPSPTKKLKNTNSKAHVARVNKPSELIWMDPITHENANLLGFGISYGNDIPTSFREESRKASEGLTWMEPMTSENTFVKGFGDQNRRVQGGEVESSNAHEELAWMDPVISVNAMVSGFGDEIHEKEYGRTSRVDRGNYEEMDGCYDVLRSGERYGDDLNVNMDRNVGASMSTNLAKKYSCGTCGRRFRTWWHRDGHEESRNCARPIRL